MFTTVIFFYTFTFDERLYVSYPKLPIFPSSRSAKFWLKALYARGPYLLSIISSRTRLKCRFIHVFIVYLTPQRVQGGLQENIQTDSEK